MIINQDTAHSKPCDCNGSGFLVDPFSSITSICPECEGDPFKPELVFDRFVMGDMQIHNKVLSIILDKLDEPKQRLAVIVPFDGYLNAGLLRDLARNKIPVVYEDGSAYELAGYQLQTIHLFDIKDESNHNVMYTRTRMRTAPQKPHIRTAPPECWIWRHKEGFDSTGERVI